MRSHQGLQARALTPAAGMFAAPAPAPQYMAMGTPFPVMFAAPGALSATLPLLRVADALSSPLTRAPATCGGGCETTNDTFRNCPPHCAAGVQAMNVGGIEDLCARGWTE